MSGPHSFYAFLRREVKASARVDDCADHGWGFDVSPRQTCPLESPDGVTFPEVDPRAKPVVGFLADQKLRAAQKDLGGLDAASVIGKDEVIQTCGTPALVCRLCQNNHPS